MSEYTEIFDARGGHYNLANRRYPEARREEAAALLDHLALPGDAPRPWLDVAAGGGYLAESAAARRIGTPAIACDASLAFVLGATAYRARTVAQYDRLPFSEGAFSGSGCLAALHHADDPGPILAEMLRVTASGGRAAVGDVAADSPAAGFLNTFVDRHTATGHHGRFRTAERLLAAFAAAGGRDARAEEREIAWKFAGVAAAVDFSRELFGLLPETPAAAIERALRALGLAATADGVRLPWRMTFVSARR